MVLAMFAGQGALPALVIGALPADQPKPLIAAMGEFPPEGISVDFTFRLETLGSLIDTLKARSVDQMCIVGSISRPSIDPALIDAATQPLVPELMGALQAGDDGAIGVIISLFEREGINIVGAVDLAPDLLVPVGPLFGAAPSPQQARDIERASQIVAAMGAADVGQACVVAFGQALAIEALPGTAWMLNSLTVPKPDADSSPSEVIGEFIGAATDWLTGEQDTSAPARMRDPALPPGGILYKAAKPGQEMRVDMPSIGPDTIAQAVTAGLDGIAIKHGEVLVLDRAAVVAACKEHNLPLWVVD